MNPEDEARWREWWAAQQGEDGPHTLPVPAPRPTAVSVALDGTRTVTKPED